ncbi:armadillo-type protein [Mycena galericulata]|nr:armadillo-type protein [Mycena galericulata]
MDPAYVQRLHDLLLQATSSDTLQVKGATENLSLEHYKNPFCIVALGTVAAGPATQAVRQLAAVEMRKCIERNNSRLWGRLPQSDREQIKEKLPQIALSEPDQLVRRSVARVIAAITRIEFPIGTWPQLIPFLYQTCVSAQVIHREVGISMLYTILVDFDDHHQPEGFKYHLQSLFNMVSQLFIDPGSIKVRITAVQVMGVIAKHIRSDDRADVKSFRASLPAIMQVIEQCVQTGEKKGARQLFDVLETLLELEVPVLGKHIPQLANFLLQLGSNCAYETELRILSLHALQSTIGYKEGKIPANDLTGAILCGLMPITTEAELEDIDDAGLSMCLKGTPAVIHPPPPSVYASAALLIINTLVTDLPPSQVFPPLRALITEYFSLLDPHNRRGAMLVLGTCIEGVTDIEGITEYMTHVLSTVWPVIETGLRDSDVGVRKAACTAVYHMCQLLPDECIRRHEVLFPGIIALVNDPEIQHSTCMTLEAMFDILREHKGIHFASIIDCLNPVLVTAPIAVKSVVIHALVSAAHAAKEGFMPYFQPAMELLQPFLGLTNEGEEVRLRGITIVTIGTFAETVGKDVFRPFFPEMMKQAFLGIELGSPWLRDCSFVFFGTMAKVFGEEFAIYLSNVVPPLLESCARIVEEEEGKEEEEEKDEEEEDTTHMFNGPITYEKRSAVNTLGTLSTTMQMHFLPYVEQCTMQLIDLLQHSYMDIRASATNSLLEIIRMFYDFSDHPEWQAGFNYQPLPSKITDLNKRALKALIFMYEAEEDIDVVTKLCSGLAQTINKIGPGFVDGYMPEFFRMALEILDQTARCQEGESEESNLTLSAEDMVVAIAKALGADFAPAFGTLYPLIAKYYKKNRSLNERSSAIGCLAEIISGMKGAITPFTEPLLKLCYRALSDPDAKVLSHAAFAVGLLVENSDTDLTTQYLQLLATLQPLFNVMLDSPDATEARDHAAGAVARLIVRNVAAVPLPQVLPILVGALPLRLAVLENRPILRALLFLFRTNGAALRPYIGDLLPVFAHVLHPAARGQLGDELCAELIQLIGALNAQDAGAIEAAGLSVFVPGE